MLNNQEYITTQLEKVLYEILPITSKRLKNLVSIIIGIILSKSVEISNISERLKDNFSEGTENSKKSKIIGATKKIHNKIVRIYSLFTSGMKWFNRCYDSSAKKYKLRFDFVLYDI